MADPIQVRHAALEAALNYASTQDAPWTPNEVVRVAKVFENYLNGPQVSPIVGPNGTQAAPVPPLVVPPEQTTEPDPKS